MQIANFGIFKKGSSFINCLQMSVDILIPVIRVEATRIVMYNFRLIIIEF